MCDKHKKELAETAAKITRRGFGILAADESNPTLQKKFDTINVPNEEEKRRQYRELLFTTEGIEKYISGVILFEETAHQSTKNGVKFIEVLQKKGIIPGIKVDAGAKPLALSEEETFTQGLDELYARCKKFYEIGIRFAKWRAVLKIDEQKKFPTKMAMIENAQGLARYAAICQANGIVPIVEPEILSDGPHSIEYCQKVTEEVNQYVFKALWDNNIFFEGMLLKPNMVTPGTLCPNKDKITHTEIAQRTITAFKRTVLPAVPGIMFLSGGMSEEEASLNLNAINANDKHLPWAMSFSFGRALQNTCVKTWAGKEENVKKAQEALMERAKAHHEAQLGTYKGSSNEAGKESLFVANYKY